MIFGDQEAWAMAWAKLLSGIPLDPPIELTARRKDEALEFRLKRR